jgi:hypothetical protein
MRCRPTSKRMSAPASSRARMRSFTTSCWP